MEEPIKIEKWSDIKAIREEKGISLFSLSEKMRLPQEKIEYLEAGNFENADPVITKLQLKNYALHVGLNYDEIIELSGLKQPVEEVNIKPLSEGIKIKKTRSYKGRKKEPSKLLIYSVIVVGVVGAIFLLNFIASNLNITSDVFEMTEEQKSSLDTPLDTKDTASFKPFLPQVQKEEIVSDVIEDMNEYHYMKISLPLKIDIFPKETMSYRHEITGLNPKEDFIIKDNPKSLIFLHPGRIIFYNSQNSRFVVSGFAFREKEFSRIVFEVNENRELTIYSK